MRIVDEETRRLVMQSRIDALEADNLFENNFMPEEPDDDGDEGDGKRRDAGEYLVEEADESEDISDDADSNAAAGVPLQSKLKSKRKEKSRSSKRTSQ